MYHQIWNDPSAVRKVVEAAYHATPAIFPQGFEQGFRLTGQLPESAKMPGIHLRQLRLKDRRVFTLRPSFVLPYMAGRVEDVDNGLFLLSFGVPIWAVTRVCGRNDMYWQRRLESLGRNNLVGTTVPETEQLPEHLVADEHHAEWCGQKGFVALTAGGNCLLGVSLTEAADEEHLRAAYGVFAAEAAATAPDYRPKSVNTDGWKPTRLVWQALFATISVLLCFLHGFVKIRERCRSDQDLHRRIWDVYRAATGSEFLRRMRDFRRWWQPKEWAKPVREALTKLWQHRSEYAAAYGVPGCHRTSNMVDRLTNRLYRLLYSGRGLHGHQATSERRLRGWGLLLNFRPFAPRRGKDCTYHSPAHRLNRKQYHENWLHNLLISASMAGCRRVT